MAFTPPTTFADGSTFTASGLLANLDSLKIYLHQPETSAFSSSAFCDTQHVLPPVLSPIDGVQLGVTGVLAQQYSGGAFVRASFTSSYLQSITRAASGWFDMPNTSVRLVNRRSATYMFHWWAEGWAGPDNDSRTNYPTPSIRVLRVSPYSGTLQDSGLGTEHVQFVQSTHTWAATPGDGAELSFATRGSGTLGGTYMVTAQAAGDVVFGLASQSTVGQAVLVNWGFVLEAWWM